MNTDEILAAISWVRDNDREGEVAFREIDDIAVLTSRGFHTLRSYVRQHERLLGDLFRALDRGEEATEAWLRKVELARIMAEGR